MPELISSKLLSLWGTREKLFIARCPLLSKNSRNILRSSFTPYFFTVLSSLRFSISLILARKCRVDKGFLPASCPSLPKDRPSLGNAYKKSRSNFCYSIDFESFQKPSPSNNCVFRIFFRILRFPVIIYTKITCIYDQRKETSHDW